MWETIQREREFLGRVPGPSAAWACGLLFVNVSISCVPRNVERFNLNFPRCAAAPLSLRPPLPLAQSDHTNIITHTYTHTHTLTKPHIARPAAARITPQGNEKNIAPGRRNKSYNELPFSRKTLNPSATRLLNTGMRKNKRNYRV